MSSSNFVEIVGFQLEKVHTGMIQWLLEADPKIVSDADKCKILNELTGKNSNFSPPLNCNIKVTREESLGRSIRADLFIELGEPYSTIIVVECKTDSDINPDQLKKTKIDFDKEKQGHQHYYCLTLFGPSQFTSRELWPGIRRLPCTILDLDNLIQIFSQCRINEHHFREWIEALKKEQDRVSGIERYLKQCKTFEDDDYWKSKGYRLWFPLYYCIYGKLIEHFQATKYTEWQANSGSNNPVLNLYQGGARIPVNIPGSNLSHELIWEFNKVQFKLKAKLGIKKTMPSPNWWNNWQTLRDRIIAVCGSYRGRTGRAAQKGQGDWVSVYQWDFDFCKQPLPDIVSETVSIIDTIKPRL